MRLLLFFIILVLLILHPLNTLGHLPGLHPVLQHRPLASPEPGGLLVQIPQVTSPQEEVEEAQQHCAHAASEGSRGPSAGFYIHKGVLVTLVRVDGLPEIRLDH